MCCFSYPPPPPRVPLGPSSFVRHELKCIRALKIPVIISICRERVGLTAGKTTTRHMSTETNSPGHPLAAMLWLPAGESIPNATCINII